MNRRLLPRLLLTPAMATLFLWMIVPLVMTIYFSLIRYNLMQPDQSGFAGLEISNSSSPTRRSARPWSTPSCCSGV